MEFISKLDSKNKIIRRAILALFVILTFFFQNTGGLFPAPAGIHAMLLIPLTVSIAMFEREFAGLFFGLLAGAMLDAFSSDSICFHAISLTIIGFAAGALIKYMMRNNFVCAMILSAAFTFIYNTLYFVLYSAFDGIEKPFIIYLRYFLPAVIYTVIFTPLYYFIVREISKKFK